MQYTVCAGFQSLHWHVQSSVITFELFLNNSLSGHCMLLLDDCHTAWKSTAQTKLAVNRLARTISKEIDFFIGPINHLEYIIGSEAELNDA